MIYGNLIGGLGNQAFIIATTYAYAKRNNFQCVFSLETNENLRGVVRRDSYKDSIFKYISRSKNLKYPFLRETGFNYSPLVKKDNVQLFGYFQSDKYFNDYKKDIQNLFLKYYYEHLQDNIIMPQGVNVSIHFRRTDYLNLKDVHPTPTLEYYNNALKYIESKVGDFNLLIFSDDIEWCKKQDFYKKYTHYFIKDTDVNELYKMSLCNHNIIANSSFSWWGSYLNLNPDKIIIAPKQWFGKKGPSNWSDIYTSDMIIM